MNQQIDYRNGKYQGEINNSRQRDGLGIFIDDDLTFYISHWSQNRMNGLSLIYISHGKYVYGEWKNNEPHGLVVFRAGETVIVGRFNRGQPVKRSLVIFERFNFACIMDEDNGDWRITDSGQLINHDTLMKYVQMIGVPVPEHYFSLTKFSCHFAKHSHLVKAYPCFSNCCYFGYHNGLAIVFNSNNALISIGAHCNENLRQFGGRFDGLRSVQEGNFQKGGEIVRYSGERPSTKIYSIFQKIHKKSLSFKNEYFDSKLKIFTNIENLLKSKLQQITNQCKKNKSMRNVDLNESLSYQDYTEQESFKINQFRDNLYGHSEKNTPSEKEVTPKKTKNNEEQVDVSLKYFKKKNKNQQNGCHNQEKKEDTSKNKLLKNLTPKRQCLESIHQNYIQKRKSSIERPQQFTLDNKKSLYSQSIRKRENIKQIQLNQPTTPSKNKEKMRSNNLRYINTNIPQSQGSQDKVKSPIAAKSNNIYKEISQARKNEQQQKKMQSLKYQESQQFKVPNFKYLIQQAEKNKISKIIPKNQPQKSPKAKKDNFNDFKINELPKQGITTYKNQSNEFYRQMNQSQPAFELQTQKYKNLAQNLSPTKEAKKSINISSLQKPNYEDIQERRKRILRQYKDLNSNGKNGITINNQNSNNKNELKNVSARPQSPYNQIMFSLSKQEQSSFGFLPISITQKTTNAKNTQNTTAKRVEETNQRIVLNEKITNAYDYPSKKDAQNSNKYQRGSQIQRFMPSYPSSTSKASNYIEKDYRQSKMITNSNQKPGSTPTRTKKNYQYLYE